jgi:hypothetical protein
MRRSPLRTATPAKCAPTGCCYATIWLWHKNMRALSMAENGLVQHRQGEPKWIRSFFRLVASTRTW